MRAADRLAQLRGHLAQHLVAVGMAARVVEELEVVEVEHHDRRRARRADRVGQRLVEAAVVREPRQRIALGERLQAVALRPHERRHVVEAADQRADLAGAGRRDAGRVVTALDLLHGGAQALHRPDDGPAQELGEHEHQTGDDQHAGAAHEQEAGDGRVPAGVRGDGHLDAGVRAVVELERPLEPGGPVRRRHLRPGDGLEAHEHAGGALDPRQQLAVDRLPDDERAARLGPRDGEHERLVLLRAPGPGHRAAVAPGLLEQGTGEREPRPRQPPVADGRPTVVDRGGERQPLAPREAHQPLLERAALPRAGVVDQLGDLGAQPLLDRAELPRDEMPRGLGLSLELPVDRGPRDHRGPDRRERHDQRQRQRERHQRLRAQGQRGAGRRRRGIRRSPAASHVHCVGGTRARSIATGRTVDRAVDCSG